MVPTNGLQALAYPKIPGREQARYSPSRCAFCGQPFEQHLYAWRSEFCADDEEEEQCYLEQGP